MSPARGLISPRVINRTADAVASMVRAVNRVEVPDDAPVEELSAPQVRRLFIDERAEKKQMIIERDDFATQVKRLTADLDKLDAEIKEVTAKRDTLEVQVRYKDAAYNRISLDASTKLEICSERAEKKRAKITSLRGDNANLKDAVEELQTTLEEKLLALGSCHAKITALQEDKERCASEIQRLEEAIKDTTTHHHNALDLVDNLQSTISGLRRNVADLSENLAINDARTKELEAIIQDQKVLLDRGATDSQRYLSERDAQAAACTKLQGRVAESEEEVTSLHEKLAQELAHRLESEMASAASLDAALKASGQTEQELVTTTTEAAGLNNELALTRKALTEKGQLADGLASTIEAKDLELAAARIQSEELVYALRSDIAAQAHARDSDAKEQEARYSELATRHDATLSSLATANTELKVVKKWSINKDAEIVSVREELEEAIGRADDVASKLRETEAAFTLKEEELSETQTRSNTIIEQQRRTIAELEAEVVAAKAAARETEDIMRRSEAMNATLHAKSDAERKQLADDVDEAKRELIVAQDDVQRLQCALASIDPDKTGPLEMHIAELQRESDQTEISRRDTVSLELEESHSNASRQDHTQDLEVVAAVNAAGETGVGAKGTDSLLENPSDDSNFDYQTNPDSQSPFQHNLDNASSPYHHHDTSISTLQSRSNDSIGDDISNTRLRATVGKLKTINRDQANVIDQLSQQIAEEQERFDLDEAKRCSIITALEAKLQGRGDAGESVSVASPVPVVTSDVTSPPILYVATAKLVDISLVSEAVPVGDEGHMAGLRDELQQSKNIDKPHPATAVHGLPTEIVSGENGLHIHTITAETRDVRCNAANTPYGEPPGLTRQDYPTKELHTSKKTQSHDLLADSDNSSVCVMHKSLGNTLQNESSLYLESVIHDGRCEGVDGALPTPSEDWYISPIPLMDPVSSQFITFAVCADDTCEAPDAPLSTESSVSLESVIDDGRPEGPDGALPTPTENWDLSSILHVDPMSSQFKTFAVQVEGENKSQAATDTPRNIIRTKAHEFEKWLLLAASNIVGFTKDLCEMPVDQILNAVAPVYAEFQEVMADLDEWQQKLPGSGEDDLIPVLKFAASAYGKAFDGVVRVWKESKFPLPARTPRTPVQQTVQNDTPQVYDYPSRDLMDTGDSLEIDDSHARRQETSRLNLRLRRDQWNARMTTVFEPLATADNDHPSRMGSFSDELLQSVPASTITAHTISQLPPRPLPRHSNPMFVPPVMQIHATRIPVPSRPFRHLRRRFVRVWAYYGAITDDPPFESESVFCEL